MEPIRVQAEPANKLFLTKACLDVLMDSTEVQVESVRQLITVARVWKVIIQTIVPTPSEYQQKLNRTIILLPPHQISDQTLWNHVYNPARLQIIDNCKTVSGTIDSIKVEQDGDFHIRLRVDSQFTTLIDSANVNSQFGDLVLEPICQNPVTQPDAIASCENFHQRISIPPVGNHVTVTGSYVHDLDHGGWAEIHPVSSISIS